MPVRTPLFAIVCSIPAIAALGQSAGPPLVDYRLLATTQTSTMERELNEAARDGYVVVSARGGETEFGGRELLAIVEREREPDASGVLDYPYEYRVLATNRTSTMRRELNEAARRGFVFAAQTVFETEHGGQEVVVIMERSPTETLSCDYELLATQRTSTMEKEIKEHAERGFFVRGMSVSNTAFGGKEIVVVTERCFVP